MENIRRELIIKKYDGTVEKTIDVTGMNEPFIRRNKNLFRQSGRIVVDQERVVSSASKFLPSERILEDDYPIYPDYIYIADGKIIKAEQKVTVGAFKRVTGFKEIRRCDIMERAESHRVGDLV